MKVAVIGSIPRDFGLSKDALKTAATSFAERSRARVGGVWHEVVVHLVRDAESDAIHRAIMGVTGATDVITQAYEAPPRLVAGEGIAAVCGPRHGPSFGCGRPCAGRLPPHAPPRVGVAKKVEKLKS